MLLDIFTPEMTVEQRRLAILEDTINWFSTDVTRRSTNETGRCLYKNPTTHNKCAIGRFIDDLEYDERIEDKTVYYVVNFTNYLPESFKELGHWFLSELQNLHDKDEYWDDNGLTELGQKRVNQIKRNYIGE